MWCLPWVAVAADPAVAWVPVEFILFTLTLLGVALFHRHTLAVGLIGLASIALYKILFTGFHTGPGVGGLVGHFQPHVDWKRLYIVLTILVAAMGTNLYVNALHADISNQFPFIGVAVWVAIVATLWLRRPDWEIMPETAAGSIFLLSLVSCASMMPVEDLPLASWITPMGLGFVSAVFDNIPLTALALKQGGYDWGVLAYAVGFGGSMMWFGSSAGVALTNMYPEARSVVQWLRHGWHVVLAYVLGFAVMMLTVGWHPHEPHKESRAPVTENPIQ